MPSSDESGHATRTVSGHRPADPGSAGAPLQELLGGIHPRLVRLFEQPRMRERWLEAVATINTEMLAGASLDESLARITEFARNLSGAAATVILLGSDNRRMSVAAMSGRLVDHLPIGRVLPVDPGLAEVTGNAETRVFPDLHDVPAFCPGSDAFGSAVVSPLCSTTGVRGLVLALQERGGPMPDVHQAQLLDSFAAQAVLALEFADKQDSERQLVLLADRNRIGQDLHDHVIQRLFAAGMGLQGALRRVDDPYAHTRIESAIEYLDQTVREIRTSIFDLHTRDSDDGLGRRLRDIVAELTADSELSPSIRIGGAVDTHVPDVLAKHVEAVVREGITNAVRHSRGCRLVLVVEVGEWLVVTIEDDGVGIPERSHQRGLANLHRRAQVCGGVLTVEAEGSGTRLRWSVPLSTML